MIEYILSLISNVKNYNLLDWIALIGGTIAIVLVIIKVIEERVVLKIEIIKTYFVERKMPNSSEDSCLYQDVGIILGIDIDVINRGKHETTISIIEFRTDSKYLQLFEEPMTWINNNETSLPLRVKANDRFNIHLRFQKIGEFDFNKDVLSGSLILKTSKKDYNIKMDINQNKKN